MSGVGRTVSERTAFIDALVVLVPAAEDAAERTVVGDAMAVVDVPSADAVSDRTAFAVALVVLVPPTAASVSSFCSPVSLVSVSVTVLVPLILPYGSGTALVVLVPSALVVTGTSLALLRSAVVVA